MTLYSSQAGLLNILIAAEIYKTKSLDLSQVFDNFILEFYKHPKAQSQIQVLLNKGLIDEKGMITERGRIFANINPVFLKGKSLAIRTNHFLFKALADGVLGDCLAHMNEETFMQVAHLVQDELLFRNPELREISPRVEKDLIEEAMVEDEILKVQAPVEVVMEGEVLTEAEVVEKEKVVNLVKVAKKKKKETA